MIDLEKLSGLPSQSLLPRADDVSHVATVGVRVAVDRQLVAGDVVGWYLRDEPGSWALFDQEHRKIAAAHADFCGRVIEMLYVDSTAQRNVMNVNLFVVLDDGELCSVHTGGTITSVDWDAMLAGDLAQEHLAITHHRFSTSSDKYSWLNEFRGFGVCRMPEKFEGEFTIPLYVPHTPDVTLTNGQPLNLDLPPIGKFGQQVT